MYFCRSDDAVADPGPLAASQPVAYPHKTMPITNAQFIPLRLSMKQRKSQRLIRAITLASSYTDKVDTAFDKPVKRQLEMVKQALNSFRGLVVALDLQRGAELMQQRDFSPFKGEIISAVEVSRRYKIMNPNLVRLDYVKFLYWIQDSVMCENIRETLGFSVARPILTVHDRLQELGIAQLLEDPRLGVCITPVPRIPDMRRLNAALRYKDRSVAALTKDWAARGNVSQEDVEACVRSLNDANNFDDDNADCAGELLQMLKESFSPDGEPAAGADLSISEGKEGSRLTHEHSKQFHYVAQTLVLWQLITRDMFRLWKLAEDDMLDPSNPYELRNTGQGLQRVQAAPNLFRAMQGILEKAKQTLGSWVGSERIHLGDSQVPNGFFFIEKYTSIGTILRPIIATIKFIAKRYEGDDGFIPGSAAAAAAASGSKDRLDVKTFRQYIDAVYGSPKKAQMAVMRDFFRHGFDGSGGDNMDDAGDCVDGRATSLFQWCHVIHSKPFFPLFMMAGFSSFEADLTL
jgi:hypothetical protein